VSGGVTPGEASGATPDLARWVRDVLRCPVTGAPLIDGTSPEGEPELHSVDQGHPLAYPIRQGIPVLLESDARPL
jgi:uncharacterized protein YbaR (Trm112 family)